MTRRSIQDSADGDAPPQVLHSPLAGQWYSAQPEALRTEIRAYLEAAEWSPGPAPRALIVPHAGYSWSGATAAAAYRQVQGRAYHRVIVLGPSHRVRLPDQIGLPDFTELVTPLGAVPLDLETLARLGAQPGFGVRPEAQRAEHSVQIQAPFLQVALAAFRLVPLVVGQLSPAGAARIAEVLRPEWDAGTLLVFSTDFTHYGPDFDYLPFRHDIPARLKQLDLEAFSRLQAGSAEGFRAYVEQTGATICGRDPLAVLAHLMTPGAELRLLAYAQSGAVHNNYPEGSVSYLAAALYGAGAAFQESPA